MKVRSKYLAGQVISGNQLDSGPPIRFDEDGEADLNAEQLEWITNDAQFSKFVDVVATPAKPKRRK